MRRVEATRPRRCMLTAHHLFAIPLPLPVLCSRHSVLKPTNVAQRRNI
jgi:hypothetical protein